MNNTIIAIGAGMITPKKDFSPFTYKNLYLNYGILGLSTILQKKGYQVQVFQGDYSSPNEVIQRIKIKGIDLRSLKYPLLLSIPSVFAIGWAKEFVDLMKSENNMIKIVIGGRWVIGEKHAWIKDKIPGADLIIGGVGDAIIEDILFPDQWRNLNEINPSNRSLIFEDIDFSLLDNFLKYSPCIEVSRGCGRGCKFCLEGELPVTPLKCPEKIIDEMKSISKLYNDPRISLYLQASMFQPNINWANSLKERYQTEQLEVRWRCETRVDFITPEMINILSQAGLKILDLGLESASAKQLLIMGKTTNPQKYLDKAQKVLEACKKYGVWAKVNILLYAGESMETYNETINWLQQQKEFIKGVSINPLILYGGGSDINWVKELGANLVDTNSLINEGFANLTLSDEIHHNDAKTLVINTSQMFMNQIDYFDLKSFSYFPREYKLHDFLRDVHVNRQPNLFPFRIENI